MLHWYDAFIFGTDTYTTTASQLNKSLMNYL